MFRLSSPARFPVFARLRTSSTSGTTGSAAPVLSDEERTSRLKPLETAGWTVRQTEDAIEKTFNFNNFPSLWGFATQVAMDTHKMNHHAQLLVSYDTVTIAFTTHSAGGLTAKDVKGAELCERAASSSAWRVR